MIEILCLMFILGWQNSNPWWLILLVYVRSSFIWCAFGAAGFWAELRKMETTQWKNKINTYSWWFYYISITNVRRWRMITSTPLYIEYSLLGRPYNYFLLIFLSLFSHSLVYNLFFFYCYRISDQEKTV